MNMQHSADTRQLFYSIAQQVLDGVTDASEQVLETVLSHSLRQLQFSICQLQNDLITMGYSPYYARITATQIAPKPLFYSTLVRVRTLGLNTVLEDFYSREPDHQFTLYTQVAPEFTAFLFDQTIDRYNYDYRESTAVQKLIDMAEPRLLLNPNYYWNHLKNVLDWSFNFPNTNCALPKEWRGFLLLSRYIRWLQRCGVSYSEARDILHTVADVLTNEHLAHIAFAEARYSKCLFHRYQDFVDSAVGYSAVESDNAEYTVARAMLRGQGFLMVVASQYAMWRMKAPEYPTLRELLKTNSRLVQLVRLLEGVVRLYDDLGDFVTDFIRYAPNVLWGTPQVKRRFIDLVGISSEPFLGPGIAIKAGIFDPQPDLLCMIREVEQASYSIMGSCAEIAPVLSIIRNVVYGSMINATYNDEIAEDIGASLMAA